MRIPKSGHRNGFALVYVLVLTVILLALALAIYSTGMRQVTQIFHGNQNEAALLAAASGVQQAFYGVETSALSYPNCGKGSITSTLRDNAKFTVQVANNYASICSGALMAADGTSVPPGFVYVRSTGMFGNAAKTVLAWFVGQTGTWPFSNYAPALFGYRSVTLSGNAMTDSYNSGSGPYPAGAGSAGNIGTNSDLYRAITMGVSPGTETVNGSAYVGPGGTAGSPTLDIIDPTTDTITGGSYVLPAPVPKPIVIDPNGGYGTANWTGPAGLIPPGKYNWLAPGANVTGTLQCGGVYSVNALQVTSSGAQLSVGCPSSNPARVYVYGAGVSGTAINIMANGIQDPNNNGAGLFIYGMPTAKTASISNAVTNSFSLYAPNAAINMGTSGTLQICGSVIGNTVTANGGNVGGDKFHYDQALGTTTKSGLTTLTQQSWQYK